MKIKQWNTMKMCACILAVDALLIANENSTIDSSLISAYLWRLIESGADSSYRTPQGYNLLHLSIRTNDKKLIKYVDSMYPQLRYQASKVHSDSTPIRVAARHGSLSLIQYLDSLGFEMHQYLYYASIRLCQKCTMVPGSDCDPEADTIHAYLFRKKKIITDGAEELFMKMRDFHERCCTKSYHAVEDIFKKSPEHAAYLIQRASEYSYYPYDTAGLTLLAGIPQPATDLKGYYFFKTIRKKHQGLLRAFINCNAVINDMSVHNGSVMSPLTIARQTRDSATVATLIHAGAHDSVWYELLVPGYWPSITNIYKPGRIWYSVTASENSVSVAAGPLEKRYFIVQRHEYWKNMKDRALFFLATNRRGGIAKIESVVSRPTLLKAGDTLRVKLSSGRTYDLTVPRGNKSALCVRSGNVWQNLLNYYSTYTNPSCPQKPVYGMWVNWAGDVDDDGKLDLLLSCLPAWYGVFDNTYYLAVSSFATNGLLLGWADEVSVYNSYSGYALSGYALNPKETAIYDREYFYEKTRP